jgi:aspartyl/asparaginyl-tRNA synthetase
MVTQLKAGDKFWSVVTIIVPGNFVAVHIAKIRLAHYGVVNKEAFLQKFFNIKRMPMLTANGVVYNSPYAMPEVEIKPEYVDLLKTAEFQIKVIDTKKFEIQLDVVRTAVTKHTIKKLRWR